MFCDMNINSDSNSVYYGGDAGGWKYDVRGEPEVVLVERSSASYQLLAWSKVDSHTQNVKLLTEPK